MKTLKELLTDSEVSAECAPYIASGDHGLILGVLSRKNQHELGSITAHDIRQYLFLVDVLIPLEMSQTITCKVAVRALELFPVFALSNPIIYGKFIAMLDALVAEDLIPDFNEATKTGILALADKQVSLIDQLRENGEYVDIQAIATAIESL
jgi:hypothetical protein